MQRTYGCGKTQHQRFHCKFEYGLVPKNRAPRTAAVQQTDPACTRAYKPTRSWRTIIAKHYTQYLDILFERVSQPIPVAPNSILIWTNATARMMDLHAYACAQLAIFRSYLHIAVMVPIYVDCHCHSYSRTEMSPPMCFDRFLMISGFQARQRWVDETAIGGKCQLNVCASISDTPNWYDKCMWRTYV